MDDILSVVIGVYDFIILFICKKGLKFEEEKKEKDWIVVYSMDFILLWYFYFWFKFIWIIFKINFIFYYIDFNIFYVKIVVLFIII